jgi:hypothetical protein
MYYIVRVWNGDKLEYEQEFPPELPNNKSKALKNLEHMNELFPEYQTSFTSQAVSIYREGI